MGMTLLSNVSVALLLHNCNKHVMIQSRVEKRRVKKIIYKNKEVEKKHIGKEKQKKNLKRNIRRL